MHADAADRLLPLLTPECFFVLEHRRLFEAIVTRHQQGEAADLIGVADLVDSDDLLIQAGGRAFLAPIAECAAGPLNAEQYARMLGDLHRRRELIEVADDVIAQAYDAGTDLDGVAITELAKTRLAGLNGIGSQGNGWLNANEIEPKNVEFLSKDRLSPTASTSSPAWAMSAKTCSARQ